jgi:hypothetical protein
MDCTDVHSCRKNPHNIIPASAEHRLVLAEREKTIPSLSVEDGADSIGYNDPQPYTCSPQSLYQAWCRQGLGIKAKVSGQITPKYRSTTVERVANIPLRAKANHSGMLIVSQLSLILTRSKIYQRHYKGRGSQLPSITKVKVCKPYLELWCCLRFITKTAIYSRMDENGQFRTIMTTMNPGSAGDNIHPTVGYFFIACIFNIECAFPATSVINSS